MLRCGNTPTWLTTQSIGVVTMAKRDYRVKTPTAKEKVVKTRQYTVGYAPNRGKPNPTRNSR
ncbi:hypothetical protein U2T78_000192 [Providencia stuartii]|uniref:Uncharacterized protein n=2 Tax=Morganellaceae TaxID=1903414 RepID=A0AAJ1JLP2_PROST|nr:MULTISPECIES: hypothetical protein [Providencia]EMA3639570.1 hypothetical protein [Providencia stuartii]MCB5216326.1 hypothetical protein [Providencia stuartii]MDE8749905.1 hypothetical protein [Providencia thailandensis]MDE8769565.1 hypothetical protein [Providencia thailandensis]MDT2044014.1 hypothetical protein [Providencia stuartii]